MKKTSLLTLILLISVMLSAQHGQVYDNLSLDSEILKMERKFAIYLPSDYESSERSYPVLYLLHGAGDDQTGWVQFGEVLHIADNAIGNGTATPMIIVMPDGNTGQRGYFNDLKNDWRYEDFFFEEFMPFVEKHYRIKGEKRYRAVSGLSMGGGGTFMYALHHPELFSSACPLSASCGPLNREDMERQMKWRGWKEGSEEEMEAWYKKHSALELINDMPEDQKKAVRWFIDCGDDDFFSKETHWSTLPCARKRFPMNSVFATAGTPGPTGGSPSLLYSLLFQMHFINTK